MSDINNPTQEVSLHENDSGNPLSVFNNDNKLRLEVLSVDEYIEIAHGHIADRSALHRSAYLPSGTTTEQSIWGEGGIYSFPASATIMSVSSSSANDTSAGTGARTLLVQGLNASYAEIQEVVSLNGQTGVSTINSFLRINSICVLTAGSGGVNAGNIYVGTGTITGGKPANVYRVALAGNGCGEGAGYCVPAGKTLFLRTLYMYSGGSKEASLRLFIRPYEMSWQLKDRLSIIGSSFSHTFGVWRAVPEKTDIDYRCQLSVGTAEVGGGIDAILINNS
jgi:hypothetical protein